MVDPMDDLDDVIDNADENGVHTCVFRGIKTRDNDAQGRNWIFFEFEVADVDDFFDKEVYSEWVRNYSHVTLDDFNNVLTPQEKQEVKRAKKRLLDFLLSLGFSETEAKSIRKDPKESEYLKDRDMDQYRVTIAVTGGGDNGRREYKNIKAIQRVVEDDGSAGMPPF